MYQDVLSGRSFFRSVEAVGPGPYALVEDGKVTTHRYWDLPLGRRHASSLREDLDGYATRLDAAVDQHPLSDVEVGSYLSGGYDSTAVALLPAPKLPGALRTFTGAFTEEAFDDERAIARAVSARCGAQAHEPVITPQRFWGALAPVCRALDQRPSAAVRLPSISSRGTRLATSRSS